MYRSSGMALGFFMLPLPDRIRELNSFLARANIQDIHNSFVSIIDNIFGYSDSSEGWGLQHIKEYNDPYLFGLIREFLSPNGRFLELLSNRLVLEFPVCKYDFPVSLLSTYTQSILRLQTGGNEQQTFLPLNSFAYYIFAFLCLPTHPKWKQSIVLCDFQASLYTSIFTDYLNFYFYGDPCALNVLTSRFQLMKSNPQVSIYQRNYFSGSACQFIPDAMDTSLSDFRLFWQTEIIIQGISEFLLSWRTFEPSFRGIVGLPDENIGMITLSAPQNHAELSVKPTSCHVFLVRCFLKYFYHFLFNTTIIGTSYINNNSNNNNNNNSNHNNNNDISTTTNTATISNITTNLTGTSNMTTNNSNDNSNNNQFNTTLFQTPQQQIMFGKLLNYRKYLYNNQTLLISDTNISQHNLMSQFLQFIICCFQHWPFDLSFEIVLETWLSSIQPWRYAQSPQPNRSPIHVKQSNFNSNINNNYDTNIIDLTDNNNMNNQTEYCSMEWLIFATQHYSLYVVPFLLFLQRAVRMDLRVCRNAHMIYRIAHVLIQDGLKSLLMTAEKELLKNICTTTSNQSGDDQTGLWNPVVIKSVQRLLNAINVAKTELYQKQIINDKVDNSSTSLWNKFFQWIYEVLLLDIDETQENEKKCEFYLNEAQSALCAFFNLTEVNNNNNNNNLPNSLNQINLPIDAIIQWDELNNENLSKLRNDSNLCTPARRVNFLLNNSTLSNSSSSSSSLLLSNTNMNKQKSSLSISSNLSMQYNHCKYDYGNSTNALTPFDRFEIIMGHRRPHVRSNLCRDDLPAFAYENRFLIQLCRILSDLINEKMKLKFEKWCSLPGFSGRLARNLLIPKISDSNSHNISNMDKNLTINPKISLRWFANYYNLLRLIILYMISYFLLGLRSPVLFNLCLIILYLFYSIVKLFFIILYEKLKQL